MDAGVARGSGMADREACLVDVYHTLVSSDFPAYMAEMAKGAGITAEAWADGYRQFGLAFRLGQVSKAEGFARILRAAGVEPRPDLVRALVDLDLELLVRNSPPYNDALPFLRALRARGIKIAIVSNCSEHTRDLLEAIGVAALADTLVLSYEVGVQKPSPEIYYYALDRLGVAAGRALFVDDQPSYCAAAAALGITAVQIVRGDPDGKVPAADTTVVRSLTEVEPMLTGSASDQRPETGRR